MKSVTTNKVLSIGMTVQKKEILYIYLIYDSSHLQNYSKLKSF